MKRRMTMVFVTGALVLGAASAALAGEFPTDAITQCRPDAVVSGTACMDKYEASAWRIPDPFGANNGLVAKVRKGKATVADLTRGGATQLGRVRGDYAPCADLGNGCEDVFAASLPGEKPSAAITWFQAERACKNSAKRLPSNAEWQAAVAGTPDPGPDNGTTDCNTETALAVAPTGSRSSCVSADGAFDMVGNLDEWVADWVPRSAPRLSSLIITRSACASWTGSGDFQCLVGAATTGEPGALLRGGDIFSGAFAGPLTVAGTVGPSETRSTFGFRCAR